MVNAKNGNEASALGDPQLAFITRQFEEQWNQAVQGRLLPSLDNHLERIDVERRPQLREILTSVEERYRERPCETRAENLSVAKTPRSKLVGLDETAEHVSSTAAAASDRTSKQRKCLACATFLPAESDESAEELCPNCLLADAIKEPTCDAAFPAGVEPPPVHQLQDTAALTSQSTDIEMGSPGQVLQPTEEIAFGDTPRDSSLRSQAPRPALPGYVILDELGRGGMGVVYRARQLGLNRLVALKMILAGDHADQAQRARFQSEAEAVAQLQHPNVVQIYDVGEYNGLPYFSLEFVDGQSLLEEMEGNPVAPERAVEVVEAVAYAMQVAHEHGIVHRDLKPANILVTHGGVPKVTDFGLVKRVEGDSGQTRTGAIVGTPCFMSPEQARGDKQVEPAMDIYALGALLYCLLTGRAPFLGATTVETVMQVIHREPLPPSRLQPQTPKDLETICLKCLEKDAAKRYASAQELADDLSRFRQGIPIAARPVSRAERAWRWCRRNPWIAVPTTAAALLALVLMIGGPLTAAVVYQQKRVATEAEERASSRLELAVDAIGSLVYESQKELADRAGMEDLREKLLAIALDDLNQIVAKNEDYHGADMATASAIRRQGDILFYVGKSEDALDRYNHSLTMLRTLDTKGELTQPHLNYAVLYDHFGQALRRSGRPVEAKDYFLKALKHFEVWQTDEPDNFGILQELATTYGRLGGVAKMLGNPIETCDYFTKSMEIRKQWIAAEPHNLDAQREMAGAVSDFSKACMMMGDFAAAEQFARESVNTLDKLCQAEPQDLTNRWNLALKLSSLGDVLVLDKRPSDAKDHYQQAVRRLRKLSEENPRKALIKQHLGRSLYGLATACKEMNDVTAAEHYRASMKLREELVKGDPKNPGRKLDLVVSLPRCGEHERAAKLAEELRKIAKSSYALYHLTCAYALCSAATSNEDQQQSYRQQALDALRDAVAAGFADVESLPRDPDLASLREDEEFKQLVKQLRESEVQHQDN